MASDTVYAVCCPRPVKKGSSKKASLKVLCWYTDRAAALAEWQLQGGKPGGWEVWLLGVTVSCCVFPVTAGVEEDPNAWCEIVHDFMDSLPMSERWCLLSAACRIAMTGDFPEEEYVDLSR